MSEQHLGAVVLVIRDNKILIGKRKNSYKAGFYGLPGGRVEPGEKLIMTAKRELQEETGLIAEELRYLGFVKEFQGEFDFIHFVFLCEQFEGEPKCLEPEKCEGWEWRDLTFAEKELLPGHIGAVQLYLSKEPFIEL